jgi:hypothetical protein
MSAIHLFIVPYHGVRKYWGVLKQFLFIESDVTCLDVDNLLIRFLNISLDKLFPDSSFLREQPLDIPC